MAQTSSDCKHWNTDHDDSLTHLVTDNGTGKTTFAFTTLNTIGQMYYSNASNGRCCTSESVSYSKCLQQTI